MLVKLHNCSGLTNRTGSTGLAAVASGRNFFQFSLEVLVAVYCEVQHTSPAILVGVGAFSYPVELRETLIPLQEPS